MKHEHTNPRLRELENILISTKQEYYALLKQEPRFEVQDYLLTSRQGDTTHLSELFGDKRELILVHNMGKHCPYCTLWADGLNGLLPYLTQRAAFVVSTPDPWQEMDAFANLHHWNFAMVSTQGCSLKADLGFQLDDGSYYPGVSTFQKTDAGKIEHVARTFFGPGDDFCALWPLFDLLAVENKDWMPVWPQG